MEKSSYIKNNDGLKLSCILSTPEKKTNKCVILCHGITSDKNEEGIFKKLADALVLSGYSVMRFDFRAHGGSEGDGLNLTLSGEVSDLKSIIDFLKKDYLEFAVITASFGTAPVSLYAFQNNVIKALVLWSPVLNFIEFFEPSTAWFKKYFGKIAEENIKENGYTEVGSRRFKISENFFKELKNSDNPFENLMKLNIPILFVHGDKDRYVSYDDSVKYSKMTKGSELKTIKEGGHVFHESDDHAKEAIEASIEFLFRNFPL